MLVARWNAIIIPRVWIICQVHKLAKKIPGYQQTLVYVLDEAWIMGGDTVKAIGTFVERYPSKDWPRIYMYGDAAGESPNSANGISDWATLQTDARMKPYRVSYHYPKANPPIVDRIVSTNAKLCNADGDIGILIHPRCKHLLTDLQQTRWVEGKRQLDHGSRQKEIFLTHVSDGLGYFVYREWPVSAKFGIRKIGEGTTVR